MTEPEPYFVIPTHRLRDVGATIHEYDEHFWRNGHSVQMIVFGDSTQANVDKYLPIFEQTRTRSELFYVGPREKEEFITYVNSRLRNKRLEPLVKNIFMPSYGGNRNFSLMYSLGGHMVSSNDDMRPYSLMEDSPESLEDHEISRGRLHKIGKNGYVRKSFDIMSAFLDVLGKSAAEVPDNYEQGENLIDTAMELETNSSTRFSSENTIFVEPGPVQQDAIVKVAQTFRSGTNDIDAIDFIEMFLQDENQVNPENLNDMYVLVNFRPVITNRNWRMDCGVAGYDNTFGLPPFFPTRLRFEDYIYRLWIQQKGIVAAHVDAAQHHTKSNYMRNPPASEVLNEEIANLLKRKINSSVSCRDELSITFDYSGEVTAQDAELILSKITGLHERALLTAASAKTRERADSLRMFAANLNKAFYGFEPDFFQHNLVRIVDDAIAVIKSTLELWPTLVEICYFQKLRHGLPMKRITASGQ
ncbi:MAG TPA: hypothetical protein VI320_34960 [Terracidiphilus sp.]|jgi:hypothetical protein